MPESKVRGGKSALLLVAAVIAAGVVATTVWYATRKSSTPLDSHPGARRLDGRNLPNPLACCGYRMDLEGEVFLWQAPPSIPATQRAASAPASMPAIPDDNRAQTLFLRAS